MGTRSFLVAFPIVAVAGVVLGSIVNSQRFDDIRPQQIVQPDRANAGRERVWRDLEPERLWRLGDDPAAMIYDPVDLEFDHRGHLFVVDGADAVREVTPDGRLVRSFGNGKGQGPGELQSITGVATSVDGQVWIADLRNGVIHVFAGDGRLLRTVRTERPAYRLANHPSGRFALMRGIGGGHLFEAFATDGSERARFGHFLEDRGPGTAMAVDGWITPDGGDGFVYAGHYSGWLGAYSFDGEQRFLVETVAAVGLPKLVRDDESTWIDREAKASTWSVSVDRGEIHLYVRVPDGLRTFGALDTYDLDSGDYLYSRRLPEYCIWAHVRDGHLYMADRTTVSKWTWTGDRVAGLEPTGGR